MGLIHFDAACVRSFKAVEHRRKENLSRNEDPKRQRSSDHRCLMDTRIL